MCDQLGGNQPKRGEQFYSVSTGKALWVNIFQKKCMIEMDK